MLDHDLIQRTLSTALRAGGELAEIFVEDKASSNAIFDDGKVENLSSGPRPGRRDPGDRRRHHRVRPHRRPVAHRPGRGGRGRRCGRPIRRRRRGGGGPHPAGRPEAQRRRHLPGGRRQGHQGRPAAPGRRHRPGGRVGHHPGHRPLRRQPPPDPRRQQRRPPHRGRPGAHAVHRDGGGLGRHRHADRLPVARVARSASSCSTPTTSTTSPARPPSGRCSSWPPAPRRPAPCPW